MEYNTARNHLIMPEYGRNIQRMVDFLKTIEDPEVRQKNAQSIIELMGILNPHLKNVEDFRHKLWDHLYLIADFDLDVKSPYPTPTKERIFKKPVPLEYPEKTRTNKHLGKHLTKVIEKAINEEDEEKRKGFTQSIAYYMKLAYSNWHKEAVHDDMIKEELNTLTDGQLEYTSGSAKVRFHTNNHKKRPHQGLSGGQNRPQRSPGGSTSSSNNNNNNNNKGRRNNNNPNIKQRHK